MSFSKKSLYIVVGLVALFGLHWIFTYGVGGVRLTPNEYIDRIILLIGINVTLAVSLNLINGMAGQFSIGHAGFMAIGGYTAAYVTCFLFYSLHGAQAPELLAREGGVSPVTTSFVLMAGLVAGGITAAIAGLVVGIPSLRLKGDYLAIVTLGFGEIIRVIIQNLDVVGGNTGFRDLTFQQGDKTFSVPVQPMTNFFWVFLVAAITIILLRNIATSTFGRALTAIREDEIAAEAMGINTTYYKVLAFVLSSAMAGVAGGLSGHLLGNLLTPATFTFVRSIEVIIMIVLGGVGSTTGAVIGAIVLTILPEALRYAGLDNEYPGLRMVIYSLMLILLMIFRPQGLLGRRELSLSWFIKRPAAKAEGGAQ